MFVYSFAERWPTSLKPVSEHHPLRAQHDAIAQLDKAIGIYVLLHQPTKAKYYGCSSDLRRDLITWYNRLRHIDTQPLLSNRMRYYYTDRADFRYVVTRCEARGDNWASVHNECKIQVAEAIKKLKALDDAQSLNSNNTHEEMWNWRAKLPVDKRRVTHAGEFGGVPVKCKWQLDKDAADKEARKIAGDD